MENPMVILGAILVAAAMAFVAIVIDAGLSGIKKSLDQQTEVIILQTKASLAQTGAVNNQTKVIRKSREEKF